MLLWRKYIMFMINNKKVITAVCAFLLLAGIVLPLASAGDEYTEVNLADVISNPTAYKYVNVKFTCIFKNMEIVDVPFYTPFSKDEYISFSVWNSGTNLWVKEVYADNFPFIFVRKDSDSLSAIIQAKKYTNMEICGIVRNAFNDVPWIEVMSVKKSGKRRFNDDSLRHMILGYDYKAEKKYELAASEFASAFNEKLPDYAAGTIYKELADICLSLGKYEEAIDYCDKASEYLDGDSEIDIIRQTADARLNTPEEPGETPVEEQAPVKTEPAGEQPQDSQNTEDQSMNEIQNYLDKIKELQDAHNQKTIDSLVLEATCRKLEQEKENIARQLESLNDGSSGMQVQIEEQKKAFNEHIAGFKKYIMQTQAEMDKLRMDNKTLSDTIGQMNANPPEQAAVTPVVPEPVTQVPVQQVPVQENPPEPVKPVPQNQTANIPVVAPEPSKKHTDFIAEEWREFDADKK